MTPVFVCRYHACNSGPVEDSNKYGRPIVAASSPRIRSVGFESASGFQEGDGLIGNNIRHASSSAICRYACCLGFRYRMEQNEYRYPASSDT